mgnify:CR=1 FL=1
MPSENDNQYQLENPKLLTNYTNPLTGFPYFEEPWSLKSMALSKYSNKHCENDHLTASQELLDLNLNLASLDVLYGNSKFCDFPSKYEAIEDVAHALRANQLTQRPLLTGDDLDSAIEETEQKQKPFISRRKSWLGELWDSYREE